MTNKSQTRFSSKSFLITLFLFVLLSAFGVFPAAAQQSGQIQELTGIIEPGEIIIYDLPSFSSGQTLYLYATATRGNLDPIIFITDTDFHPDTLELEFETALDTALLDGADPLEVIDEVRDQHALAWDDDSGGGLSAALEFVIPQDGNYRLVTAGALSISGRHTSGDYRILVGLDAPEVLTGKAFPTGETIATLNAEATPPNIGVQELTGTLSPERPSTFLELHDFKAGDTLQVYLEATSGDLVPRLVLANFADKPLRSSNLDGKQTHASFEYTFPTDSRNYLLEIGSCCEEADLTQGDYRLLLGVNAPQVLSGQAEIEGREITRPPIDVGVGLKLEQIVKVDQQSEFFTTVANLHLEWVDPALAFNPESCHCDFKIYSAENFNQFLSETNNRWPDYSFHNQQGNRWLQNLKCCPISRRAPGLHRALHYRLPG